MPSRLLQPERGLETNAVVDASFTDAVTGTKQIRMLGLDGKYTQIMFDNQPAHAG